VSGESRLELSPEMGRKGSSSVGATGGGVVKTVEPPKHRRYAHDAIGHMWA